MLFSIDQKPSIGIQLDRGHALSDGLVACWLMNEGSGDKAYDCVGLTVGTFVASPTWEPDGVKFVAASFQRITTLVKPSTSQGTIVQRFFFPSLPTLANAYISAGAQVTNRCYFGIENVSGTTYIGGAIGSAAWNVLGITPLAASTWYSGALTWGSGNGSVYLNGKLDKSQSLTVSIPDTYFWIGANSNASGYANAIIAYTYIYNRRLSGEEIAYLHAFPYDMFCAPVAASIAAEAGITGVLAASCAPVAAAVVGEVGISGEVAAVCPPLTASVNGETAISGEIAAVCAPLTAAVAGETAISGEIAAVCAPTVCAITGEITGEDYFLSGYFEADYFQEGEAGITGIVAAVCAPVIASIIGITELSATINAQTAALIASMEGSAEIAGQMAATVSPLTAEMAGTIGISGEIGVEVNPVAANIDGAAAISGDMVIILSPVIADIAGILGLPEITGSFAATSAPVMVQIRATVAVEGVIDAEIASIIAAIYGRVGEPGIIGSYGYGYEYLESEHP